jgi:hypothetical protein
MLLASHRSISWQQDPYFPDPALASLEEPVHPSVFAYESVSMEVKIFGMGETLGLNGGDECAYLAIYELNVMGALSITVASSVLCTSFVGRESTLATILIHLDQVKSTVESTG